MNSGSGEPVDKSCEFIELVTSCTTSLSRFSLFSNILEDAAIYALALLGHILGLRVEKCIYSSKYVDEVLILDDGTSFCSQVKAAMD